MTTFELIDENERFLSNSGIMTDESKWDSLFILALTDKYSRMAIKQDYAQNRRLNPLWLNKYDLEFSKDAQTSDCVVTFSIPPLMILSDTNSGFYIGSKVGACPYRIVKSRGDLANALAHKSTNKPHQLRVLITGTDTEIYGNPVEGGMVEGIFLNPTRLPTFNLKTDQYPLNDDLIPLMQQLMYKYEGQFLSLKPVDVKPDNADTYNTPNT